MSLFDQLMSPHYGLQTVHLQEFLDDVLAEDVASSSVVHRPAFSVSWVRVGPHQVTHRAGLWDIVEPIDLCDFVEIRNGWRKPTMNAEYLRVYDCCEWQVGENFYDTIPDVMISIFPKYLIIKAICPCKRCCLVIAPKQNESLRLDAFEYQ